LEQGPSVLLWPVKTPRGSYFAVASQLCGRQQSLDATDSAS
jgi:hypothetical protein